MKTIFEVLTLSTDYLAKRKLESPRREAEYLLSDFLGINRMGLYLDFERPLGDEELDAFRSRLKRRGEGEPGPYIQGSVNFYGLKLKVNRHVLIPRVETEILVDQIVKELQTLDLKEKKLLDLCTGSGCIGLALKNRFPDLKVVLSDLSEEALKVTQENRGDLDVELVHGNLLEPFASEKFDFVVCNPPYISAKEYDELSYEVKDFEPKEALLAGHTGLEFYERLGSTLPACLNPGARVWFEIGAGQGHAVLNFFSLPLWKNAQLGLDWAGHQRFISLEIE